MNKWMLLAIVTSYGLSATAACPTWPTGERFTLSGEEVTDKRTGLVWARCSVGQTWTGSSCTGAATVMEHEVALRHAANQIGWRLPNVKELASLTDRGCFGLAIDLTAFPATSSDFYWSSTPLPSYRGDASDQAWYVGFYFGVVGNGARNSSQKVRLVRVSQ